MLNFQRQSNRLLLKIFLDRFPVKQITNLVFLLVLLYKTLFLSQYFYKKLQIPFDPSLCLGKLYQNGLKYERDLGMNEEDFHYNNSNIIYCYCTKMKACHNECCVLYSISSQLDLIEI